MGNQSRREAKLTGKTSNGPIEKTAFKKSSRENLAQEKEQQGGKESRRLEENSGKLCN